MKKKDFRFFMVFFRNFQKNSGKRQTISSRWENGELLRKLAPFYQKTPNVKVKEKIVQKV